MRRSALLLLSVWCMCLVPMVPAAAQTQLRAICQRAPEAAPTQIYCDVRATDPTELATIAATLSDGRTVDSSYERFNHRASSSAWLFLVQRTSHPKDGAREVQRLLRPEGKRSYGVVAFGDTTEVLAPIGSSPSALQSGLDEIGNKTSTKTALYTSAYQAILDLAAHKADRRAIVIVADGRSDRDSHDAVAVIELAKQRNIVIHTFAFTDRDGSTAQNRDALRRLAVETGGRFLDVGTERRITAEAVASFADVMENGGLVKLKASDVPNDADLVLAAAIASGTKLTASKGDIKWGPLSPVREVGTMEKVSDWSKQNPMLLLAAALVALGGLGLVVAMGRALSRPASGGAPVSNNIYVLESGGQTQRPAAIAGNTVILPGSQHKQPDTVYAWLQFLDANSTQMPIGATSVRIGRHEDNDICLANQSVHRQHAVIHMKSDGSFDVRDLGGKNGVMVNGRRVEQTQLADGDVIEFGEVRARFILNRSA